MVPAAPARTGRPPQDPRGGARLHCIPDGLKRGFGQFGAYLAKILECEPVLPHLHQHQPDLTREFESICDVVSLDQ
jgi:hypothetical protein